MKDDNIGEIIVNHNYFIRTVIKEIAYFLGVSLMLGVLIFLIASFMPDNSWLVAILVVFYPIYFFIKIGKIKSIHDQVTSIEDRIVKNSMHNSISKEQWKL